jgi:hypothetical protein
MISNLKMLQDLIHARHYKTLEANQASVAKDPPIPIGTILCSITKDYLIS